MLQGKEDVLLDVPNLSIEEITIDRNPQILERLLTSVDNTVDTVGGVANTTLQPAGVVDNTVGTVGGIAGQVVPRGQ